MSHQEKYIRSRKWWLGLDYDEKVRIVLENYPEMVEEGSLVDYPTQGEVLDMYHNYRG